MSVRKKRTFFLYTPYISGTPKYQELRHNLKCEECGKRYSSKVSPVWDEGLIEEWNKRRKTDIPLGKRSIPMEYMTCKGCTINQLNKLKTVETSTDEEDIFYEDEEPNYQKLLEFRFRMDREKREIRMRIFDLESHLSFL